MIRWRFEETIARPPQEVWEFAADVSRHPQWMGVSDARLLHGRPTEVGSRLMESFKLGPRRYEVEMEVGAADPAKRIAWRVIRGAPFSGEFTLDLEPLENGQTRAVWWGTMQPIGLWRLLTPILAMEAKEGEARELRRLKQAAEATPVARAMA